MGRGKCQPSHPSPVAWTPRNQDDASSSVTASATTLAPASDMVIV